MIGGNLYLSSICKNQQSISANVISLEKGNRLHIL